MKLSNLISNPVLTEGQIKNSLAMFQWLIDKIWWLIGKASDVKKSVVKMLSERCVEFLFDENNIRDIHDIRVPDDFDEEAAVSYFQDLVTEEYGK